MLGIAKRLHELLADKIGISEGFGGFVYAVIVCAVMIMVAVGINWILQAAFRWVSGKSARLKKSRWQTQGRTSPSASDSGSTSVRTPLFIL